MLTAAQILSPFIPQERGEKGDLPVDLMAPRREARSHRRHALTDNAKGLYPADAFPLSSRNSLRGSDVVKAEYATVPYD